MRQTISDDPLDDLLRARRATASFARSLNALSDGDLDRPVPHADWTKRHVVAHIGYHARAMAEVFRQVSTGNPAIAPPMPELAKAATLPARALRHLFDHSAIPLDVEWRDLPGPLWARQMTGEDGANVLLSQCPDLRARVLQDCERLMRSR